MWLLNMLRAADPQVTPPERQHCGRLKPQGSFQVISRLRPQGPLSRNQTLTWSLSCGVLASAGLWMTGTCRGGEAPSMAALGVSSGAGTSHSVTTCTSSSDGRSVLGSFGDGGLAGLRTLCRITPGHIGPHWSIFPPPLAHKPPTPSHLHMCIQRSRGPGRRGNARPSRSCRSGRPEDAP